MNSIFKLLLISITAYHALGECYSQYSQCETYNNGLYTCIYSSEGWCQYYSTGQCGGYCSDYEYSYGSCCYTAYGCPSCVATSGLCETSCSSSSSVGTIVTIVVVVFVVCCIIGIVSSNQRKRRWRNRNNNNNQTTTAIITTNTLNPNVVYSGGPTYTSPTTNNYYPPASIQYNSNPYSTAQNYLPNYGAYGQPNSYQANQGYNAGYQQNVAFGQQDINYNANIGGIQPNAPYQNNNDISNNQFSYGSSNPQNVTDEMLASQNYGNNFAPPKYY